MNPIANPGIDATMVFGFVTALVNVLKPYVEGLPFAQPGTAMHDSTLRILNWLLNLAGVVFLQAYAGQIVDGRTLVNALPSVLVYATLAAVGSHTVYVSKPSATVSTPLVATTLAAAGVSDVKTPVVDVSPIAA